MKSFVIFSQNFVKGFVVTEKYLSEYDSFLSLNSLVILLQKVSLFYISISSSELSDRLISFQSDVSLQYHNYLFLN